MGSGPGVKVSEASFAMERGAEVRAMLKLGFETPEELEAALTASGWTVHRGRDGAVDDIDFTGEAFGAEFNALLPALGPFVAAGSFIELEGDDGAKCRWDFDGHACSFVDAGLAQLAV
jgi:hypothetical protein